MLSTWLTGWRKVSVPSEQAAELLELCRREGLIYTHLQSDEATHSFCLRMSLAAAKRCEALCCEACIPLTVGRAHGLPALGQWMLRRPGVPVGLVLGVILVWLSGQYVWDIRIEGTSSLSRREVRDILAECGFSVGSSLRGFAADRLENRVLLADRRIAWISVNRKGTVAYVQLREASYPPEESAQTPANIVATRSGVIERVELIRGNIQVAAGQTVAEGQLLVSGLYDSQTVGIRTVRAEAHIYARTTHREVISIPLQVETAVSNTPLTENGAISCEKFLIFFGKTIKFSKKTGNQGVLCDTIEEVRELSLREGIGSPLAVRTVWYLPTAEPVTLTRTPAEAEELAYLELSRRIAAIPGGAELLSKTVCVTLTEDMLLMEATFTCVEDIAATTPIEVVE